MLNAYVDEITAGIFLEFVAFLLTVSFSAPSRFLAPFSPFGRGNGTLAYGGDRLRRDLGQRSSQRLWLGHDVRSGRNRNLSNLHGTPSRQLG